MLTRRQDAVAMRITATNTHRPTLDHIRGLTGIGWVNWRALKHLSAPDRHKLSGFWIVNGDGAESVLRQILPYLVTKKRQAELAITFQEQLRTPALKADRTWQMDYMTRMQALNRRGPK